MATKPGAWIVVLNNVALGGGYSDAFDYGFGEGFFGLGPFGGNSDGVDLATLVGWLSSPPDGMGVPALRTEDITFPQRDGSQHYSDWYEARTITLAEVQIPNELCNECSDVRSRAKRLMEAWARQCDDIEMVIYTDCYSIGASGEDRAISGPFGVIGRPRVANLVWTGQGTRHATATLRFDAVDHRLYILDEFGTPGSGTRAYVPVQAYGQGISYESVILTDMPDMPAAYWRLNEPAGSTISYTSRRAPNNPDWSVPFYSTQTRGLEPLAINLDRSVYNSGANNEEGQPWKFPADLDSSRWTLEMWRKGTGQTVWNNAPIFTLKNAANETVVAMSTDSILTLIDSFPQAAEFSPAVQSKLKGNQPHHIAVTGDSVSDILRVYIDGVLETTINTGGPIPGIANGANLEVNGAGFYSDLALYPLALSPDDVYRHYLRATVETEDPEPIDVGGNVSVPFSADFYGPLTNPQFLFPDGSFVGLRMTIEDGQTATLDTSSGVGSITIYSSTSESASYVLGDPFMQLDPNETVGPLLVTDDYGDTGYASLSWRPAVVSG